MELGNDMDQGNGLDLGDGSTASSDSESDALSFNFFPYSSDSDDNEWLEDEAHEFFMPNAREAPPRNDKAPYHAATDKKCYTLRGLRVQYTEQTFLNEFRFSYEQMVYLCEQIKVEEFIQIQG